MKQYKRYCKVMQIADDAELVANYKKVHAMGAAWPEVTQGMKDVGIVDMEIYLSGTTLFMIMDTVADFDHDSAMEKLSTLPRQAEWEAYVSKFQETASETSAKEKWQLIERIYEMDQVRNESMNDGYLKDLKI